jgi:hypothetical protein
MSKPSKVAEYLAEAERLRETVDAYRRARGSGADDVASKPERRRLPPLPRPTEIEGYPLNSAPPTETPNYWRMARVTVIQMATAEIRGASSDEAGRKAGVAEAEPMNAFDWLS